LTSQKPPTLAPILSFEFGEEDESTESSPFTESSEEESPTPLCSGLLTPKKKKPKLLGFGKCGRGQENRSASKKPSLD